MIFLENHRDIVLRDAFVKFSQEQGYTNVFNPSIAIKNDHLHITFRAESYVGEKPFRSIYTSINLSEHTDCFAQPLDLSELLSQLDLPRVADPKLVLLGNDVYVTFNTGHLPGKENDIYLMRIWPTVGPAQRCHFIHRQQVEKNWAFFIDSDGMLNTLYSLSPLTLLSLTEGNLGISPTLQFEQKFQKKTSEGCDLTIGTQLSFVNENHAYLVAHQKFTVLKWRGYFGKLVRIDFNSGNINISSSRKKISHSLVKMFLVKKRHNPNLLWATYFSGLVINKDHFLLAYGINDLEFGFARVPMEKLWL